MMLSPFFPPIADETLEGEGGEVALLLGAINLRLQGLLYFWKLCN